MDDKLLAAGKFLASDKLVDNPLSDRDKLLATDKKPPTRSTVKK